MRSHDDPLDAQFSLGSDVVLQEFPGEVVALNLRSGRFYGLNATAARVLRRIEAGAKPRAAADAIAAEAAVASARVCDDVRVLLDGLIERGLIVPDG